MFTCFRRVVLIFSSLSLFSQPTDFKFEFPDIMKEEGEEKTLEEKQQEEMKRMKRELKVPSKRKFGRKGAPSFFGL